MSPELDSFPGYLGTRLDMSFAFTLASFPGLPSPNAVEGQVKLLLE